MKKITLLFLLLSLAVTSETFAQKYFSRAAHVTFHSETPFENIEAKNEQATCIVDLQSGEVAFAVLMKSFQFKKALMEEHFNENYVESSKFPKATFKGKIISPNIPLSAKTGAYKVVVQGEMTMHGVTKPVKTEGTIEVIDDKVIVKSDFIIVPEDYDIKIPSLVRDKIEKNIKVKVESNCDPYKK